MSEKLNLVWFLTEIGQVPPYIETILDDEYAIYEYCFQDGKNLAVFTLDRLLLVEKQNPELQSMRLTVVPYRFIRYYSVDFAMGYPGSNMRLELHTDMGTIVLILPAALDTMEFHGFLSRLLIRT